MDTALARPSVKAKTTLKATYFISEYSKTKHENQSSIGKLKENVKTSSTAFGNCFPADLAFKHYIKKINTSVLNCVNVMTQMDGNKASSSSISCAIKKKNYMQIIFLNAALDQQLNQQFNGITNKIEMLYDMILSHF